MKNIIKGVIISFLLLLLLIPQGAFAMEEVQGFLIQPNIKDGKSGDKLTYKLQVTLPEGYQSKYKSMAISVRLDEKLDLISEGLENIDLSSSNYKITHSKMSKSQKALFTLVIPDLNKLSGDRDFTLKMDTKIGSGNNNVTNLENSFVLSYTDMKGVEFSYQKDATLNKDIVIDPIYAYETKIKGKAMGNAEVLVYRGSTQVAYGKTDSEGNFEIVLNPQPEGVSLRIHFKSNNGEDIQELIILPEKESLDTGQVEGKETLQDYIEAVSNLPKDKLSQENKLQIESAVTRGKYLMIKSVVNPTEIKLGIKDLEEAYTVFRPAYMNGYPNGTFAPTKAMTRAEVASVFTKVMTNGKEEVGFSSFTDVKDSKWYAGYIGFMEKNNILSGYKDGTFKPEKSITRAEFAALVARYMNLQDKTGSKEFSDVKSNHWSSPYIAMVSSAGIMNGRGGDKFAPNANITRQEVATVLNKITNRKPSEEIISKYGKNPFKDVSKDSWAYYQIMEVTGN